MYMSTSLSAWSSRAPALYLPIGWPSSFSETATGQRQSSWPVVLALVRSAQQPVHDCRADADRPDGSLRFRRVKAPEREELEHLVQQIAARVGRALERMGLLQRDADDCRDAGGRAKQEPELRVRGSSWRRSRTRMRCANSSAVR